MNKKILVVDDEIEICRFVKSALEEEDFQVEIALSGEEGIEKLQSGTFDAVLVDIRLEIGISGIEVIRECRRMPSRPKVLVLSATPERLLKPDFEKEGVADTVDLYLEKPLDLGPEAILRHIKKVLRK